jgi:hypothetical protein
VLTDSRGKQVTFAKGKPVDVPAVSTIAAKIQGFMANDRDPYRQWKVAEERHPPTVKGGPKAA